MNVKIKNSITAILGIVFLILSGIVSNVHAAATITVVNLDSAGEGFNDPSAADPDSTAGGNTGATLGAQRLQAFQFAAGIWAAELDSSIEIRVDANFDPQFCTSTSATLGSAGPNTVNRDFTGALQTNTYYPTALANKLAGVDLAPASNDIGATFNSAIGTTCAFPNVWYYGLDASPPGNKIDFVTVVAHELAHGLGFLTLVDLATGAKFLGFDDTFMLNLENHSTGTQYPDMTDAERVTASTNTGNLHWTGSQVVSNSAFLTAGKASPSGHVQMFAPSPAQPGSSVSHFDTALSPDEQEEPSYTGPDHSVGLSRPLMGDIGWFSSDPIDVNLIVDLSGSFSDDIAQFKADAPVLIDALAAEFDLKVGLGSFVDYPISPFGDPASGDYAYQQEINITSDFTSVKTAIAGLTTKNGDDAPESQLPALFQAATGSGQDLSSVGFPGASIPAGQQADFRDGVEKLFILWTDAGFHLPGDPGTIPYPGPSFDDTVNAVLALDLPKVCGIVPGGDPSAESDVSNMASATGCTAPMGGVDCDEDGTIDILEGDPIVCTTASTTGIGVAGAIAAVVEAALEPDPIDVFIRKSINLRSRNVLAAILSTPEFDAQTVDPASVCLSSLPEPGVGDCTEQHRKPHAPEDVDDDGDLDLVLHFNPNEAGLMSGDNQACLTGTTFDGIKVAGCNTGITVF